MFSYWQPCIWATIKWKFGLPNHPFLVALGCRATSYLSPAFIKRFLSFLYHYYIFISSVESQKGVKPLTLFSNVLLKAIMALSLCKVYGGSALLVLSWTLLNSANALLALSWRYFLHILCFLMASMCVDFSFMMKAYSCICLVKWGSPQLSFIIQYSFNTSFVLFTSHGYDTNCLSYAGHGENLYIIWGRVFVSQPPLSKTELNYEMNANLSTHWPTAISPQFQKHFICFSISRHNPHSGPASYGCTFWMELQWSLVVNGQPVFQMNIYNRSLKGYFSSGCESEIVFKPHGSGMCSKLNNN